MADPKRLDAQGAYEAADRDSRTEALLVEGLDRYFAGQYEDAIHIWTRVLFLDRTHARARAYIDRARTTLAERHRQSEEMLQASHELLEQGRTEAARHLLTEAVAKSGDDEKAAALRLKLERLERMERANEWRPSGSSAARAATAPATGWHWPRQSRSVLVLSGAAALGLALLVLAMSPAAQDWIGMRSPGEQLAPASVVSKWPPALSSSDVALVRARNLYSRGRLAEALQVLDRVSQDGPARVAADELRIEIEQMLLATGPGLVASKVDRR
jgi:tetratricopeptide (TPR) repeat protein